MKISLKLSDVKKSRSSLWPIIDRTCLYNGNITPDNNSVDYQMSGSVSTFHFPTSWNGDAISRIWGDSPFDCSPVVDSGRRPIPGWVPYYVKDYNSSNYYVHKYGDYRYIGSMPVWEPYDQQNGIDSPYVWWNSWELTWSGSTMFNPTWKEDGTTGVRAISVNDLDIQTLTVNLTNNLSLLFIKTSSNKVMRVKNGYFQNNRFNILESPLSYLDYHTEDFINDGLVREAKFPASVNWSIQDTTFVAPLTYDTMECRGSSTYTVIKHWYNTKMTDYAATNFKKNDGYGISSVSCNALLRKQYQIKKLFPDNTILFGEYGDNIIVSKSNFIGEDPDIIVPDDFIIEFKFDYEAEDGILHLVNELNELLKMNGYIAKTVAGVRHQPNDVLNQGSMQFMNVKHGFSSSNMPYCVTSSNSYIDAAEVSFDNNDYDYIIPDDKVLPLENSAGGTFDFNSFIGSFKNIISGVKSTINNDSILVKLRKNPNYIIRNGEPTTLDKTNEFVGLTNKMKEFYNVNSSFITLTKSEDMIKPELIEGLSTDDTDFIAQYEAWVLTGQMNIIASWNHSDVLMLDPAVLLTSYSALLKITCNDMINVQSDRISQSIISLNESASDVLNVMSANISAKINLDFEKNVKETFFKDMSSYSNELQGVDIGTMTSDEKHQLITQVQKSYNDYFNAVMINDSLDTNHPLKDTSVDTIYRLFTGSLKFIGDLIGGIIQFSFGWIKELFDPSWEKEPVLVDSNSVSTSNIINYVFKLNVVDNVVLTKFASESSPYLSIFHREDKDYVLKVLRNTGNGDVSKGYILVPGFANSTIILRNFTFEDEDHEYCACTMEWFLSTNMKNDSLSYNDIAPMCETFISDSKRVSQYAIDNNLMNLNFKRRFIDKGLDQIETSLITINDSYWDNDSSELPPTSRGIIVTSLIIAGVVTGLTIILRVINRSITRWKVGMAWEEISKLISSMSLFVKTDIIELFSAGLFRVKSDDLISLNKVISINERTGSLERYAIRDVSYNLSALGGDLIIGSLVGITTFLGVRGMKLRYSGNSYYYQTNYGMSEGRSAYMSVRKEIADMGTAVASGVTSAVMIAKSSFQMLFPSVDFSKTNSSSALIDEDPSVDELVLNDVESNVIKNQESIIEKIDDISNHLGINVTPEMLMNQNHAFLGSVIKKPTTSRTKYIRSKLHKKVKQSKK